MKKNSLQSLMEQKKQLNGKLQGSDSLINKIVVNVGISKDWLLKGDGVPFAKNDRPSTIIVGEMEERRRGTPVYDIDVTAGHFSREMLFADDNIIGHVFFLLRIKYRCDTHRLCG